MSFAFIEAGEPSWRHRFEPGGERRVSDQPHVPDPGGQPERVLCLAGPPGLPAPAAGHGVSGARHCPRTNGGQRLAPSRLCLVERDLRQPAHATCDLIDDGHAIGRHRTARLMRQNGLIARQKRRFRRTTDSEHAWPVAPNLVAQNFRAEQPDRKWGADISYVWTAEGWLYLAVILDLYSRRVVGWATSDRLKRDLAVDALRRALAIRRPSAELTHHSDRGSQYCSIDYQAELRRHGIRISMSGRGNAYDNAMVETFFKTIKSELIWPTAWRTRQQAENAIARYIDGFYNPVRRHSSLGFRSPIAFERKALEGS